MLLVALACLDAAAGAHLIRYAVRRERRDKDALLVTGMFLVVCAVLLVVISAPLDAADVPGPSAPAVDV